MNENFKYLLDKIAKIRVIQFLTAFTVLYALWEIVHALINKTIPESNREALINMLGIIEGALLTIITFYYGSSKGSQKKSDTIKNALETESKKNDTTLNQ
jgi:hypothetical protein